MQRTPKKNRLQPTQILFGQFSFQMDYKDNEIEKIIDIYHYIRIEMYCITLQKNTFCL